MQQMPELISFHGNWSLYENEIYKYYCDEIANGNLTFESKPIRCQYRPPSKGKHFGFWHIISTGEYEDERLPDLKRCERIRWIAWIIKNYKLDNKISWWQNKRKGNTHIVLLLEEENYVVILAKREGYYLLKTAYCIEPHRKKLLMRERDNLSPLKG